MFLLGKLPYVEAVIREMQRCANVTPFGILRCNLEETTLFGYRIPKKSTIMVNYLAINQDPTLWDEPEKFKPERFLNKEGKIHEPPYFMPFSIGKKTSSCKAQSKNLKSPNTTLCKQVNVLASVSPWPEWNSSSFLRIS